MNKLIKPLTIKTSEKICENLREQSVQGFKDLTKILAAREKTANNAECMAKLQQLAVSYPELAQQLNQYLQESIKFPVQKSFEQKLEEFFSYVKLRSPEHIHVIFDTLKKFDKETKSSDSGQQSKESKDRLIQKFLQLFNDDEQAYNKAKFIFQFTEPKEKPAPEPVKNRVDVDYYNKTYRQSRRDPTLRVQNNRTVIVEPVKIVTQAPRYPPDDLQFILKYEKIWADSLFETITKIIFLFENCVIGVAQVFDLVPQALFESAIDYQAFKDMIETREGSRRRTSNPFKPLNDTDFSNSIRATFSYVEMPWCYPVICKGKTGELKSLLNDKWVSVPHGSEHSNFYIRTKNQFEELLLKSEDERYEFDIYSYRLKTCDKLLDKIINTGDIKQKEVDQLLHHVIGMNIVQTIYRNTTKEQKEQLEKHLKINVVSTCTAIKQRVVNQMAALKTIREVHGLKAWFEIADKNFVKSLDRKCSQFKRNERDNTKPQFFQTEIEEKIKFMKKKQRSNIFQDPVNVFSVLNSFESYSRTEKCISHKIKPEDIPTYDVDKYPTKELLPAMMLLFQNKQVTTLLYSFFIYYVNNCIPNDGERNKNKRIGSKFFEKILKFNYTNMNLPDNFKQQQFLELLSKFKSSSDLDFLESMIAAESPGFKLHQGLDSRDNRGQQRKQVKIKDSFDGQFAYLPLKDQNSTISYFSFNMFVVLRMIYTIYQRLLRAYQLLYNYPQTQAFNSLVGSAKLNLFKILFMVNVKSKQNSRFEDQLSDIFGLQSYMFSTIYRLFQTLIKSFQSVFSDAFSCKLLDLITTQNSSITPNQTMYFICVNRLTIPHANSDNLFRLNHNNKTNLITVNYFKSAYKSWDDGRQKRLQQKIEDIQRNVQFYVTQPIIEFDGKSKGKKKEKDRKGVKDESGMEYFCFSSGLKLYSRVDNQDYFEGLGKKGGFNGKNVKKEIKRIERANEIFKEEEQVVEKQEAKEDQQ